jgi:hypothetical protein
MDGYIVAGTNGTIETASSRGADNGSRVKTTNAIKNKYGLDNFCHFFRQCQWNGTRWTTIPFPCFTSIAPNAAAAARRRTMAGATMNGTLSWHTLEHRKFRL